ncbi:diguanylate cyclase [Marinobacter nitratireducens]|uniref:Diguanylate cyclase n=1 Tax=Marinobacter nitratireducens TaxID=1137280 RepID=A0A072N062_9GAMM|nr:diguanylate cyclase [Marinobacter nitratireducens]KEF30911.1 diguanylate cyclase [Marinobacter nitratireducens]
MRSFLLLFFLLSSVFPIPVSADHALTFGVFAYRPDAVMEEEYKPMAEYLSREVGVPIELEILDQPDLNQALASNRLDFVLTNPSHFLVIRSERSLTGVLATLVRRWEQNQTASLGGVVVTLAEREDIATLEDLAGQTIASPGIFFLGGYQAQMLELREAGVRARDIRRVKQLSRHDRVIQAVLSGDVDAGFVRTGIIEQMALEDPDLPNRLKVIHPQNLSGFPFRVSTRLYPEWPLAALPHVDSAVVRKVASALFALERTDPAAVAAGIAGFAPPMDYQSVEDLARTLRIPPYDQVPMVTWVDVIHQYRLWVFTIVVLVILLIASSLWLGRRKRMIGVEQRRQRRMILGWPQPMLVIRDGVFVDSNRAAVDLLRYTSRNSLIGKDVSAFSPQVQPDGRISQQKLHTLIGRAVHGEVQACEWKLARSDGSEVWVDMTLAPIHEKGEPEPLILCSWYDITRRRNAEQRQRLAASVFDHAREAIFITDAHGTVIDVNDAYAGITGRSRESAIGSTPPLPMEEGSGVFQSARQDGFWSGEFEARRETGETIVLTLTISGVRDEHGDIGHFVGVFSDITKSKEQERKLRLMAHFDALTGLPNRVLFADRLQQSMSHARRQGFRLAVLYIDLDEFKPVNDAFGHEAGDRLLVEVAKRMRQALREEDTLARLGGDEFSAIVVNVGDEAALESLLSRLLEMVSAPVWVSNHSVEVSVSVGYTLYPQDGTDLDGDQLLRQADQAMYRAKHLGKNQSCRFSEGKV